MAPLAGKPPFATDEPDSFYETPRAPTQRIRQAAPQDPNKRTSAYDVYNNYLGDDKNKLSVSAPDAASNRNSGIGALLLNMDMGDDSDSDDDDDDDRRRAAKPPASPLPSPSKNAVLAAATGASSSARTPPPPPSPASYQQQPQMRQVQPAPIHHQQQQQTRTTSPPQSPSRRSPQPIAAPRPGYAAPIAQLNLARPEAVALGSTTGSARQHPMPVPAPLRIVPPQQHQNPFDPSPRTGSPHASSNPFAGSPNHAANPFASPSPHTPHTPRPPLSPSPSLHSSSPHPLLPPVTPITPAFIRPAIPAPAAVKFEEGAFTVGKDPIPRRGIMRGDKEDPSLIPSRGEKGDDFWRRFSMVVKSDRAGQKESSWLRKTQAGSNAHSRWVWIVGLFLIVLIAGGIAVGVYFTRNAPAHQQPTAIGGSADNVATYASSSSVAVKATGSAGKVGVMATGTGSVLHVSPTNTVARREAEPEPTFARRHALLNAKRGLSRLD